MTSGMGSGSGGLSPEQKRKLVKIALTALAGAISVIFGVEISIGGLI